ncbi:phosphatidate cytidylyltransferase [Cohnella lubricantis]|uniref:Phosphatidate cytidylyltransferase n=1 Tax=Cohnella lubricantis TaxID=2163172 RepID=A0A841THJ1_9BACL|nr:phosphatidate cytidylyltransferase [Cohnella lubricantis]MBB6679379.1 phosphatidate cytidylyltransferase [Cohnella lubricantis]MBP2117461.1 phosphatidate cytidylyltransferase [Cohnella lubricantis]
MGQRLVTGIVAGAAFIALLLLGDGYYEALLALLALLGYGEYVRLNNLPKMRGDVLIGFAAVLVLSLPNLPFGWTEPPILTAAWLAMFLLLAATVTSKNRTTLDQAALLYLGVIYIGLGFRYMAETRDLPHGLFWCLLTFFCIWASDAGAYFIGRAFGKRKLWPAISPNKTIEGAVGGLVIAVVVGIIFSLIEPEWLGIGRAITIGLAAAVAGTMGDLIQSAYKRLRGVKDSGQLLPGHGGVLDRTDSWLIVFPIVHLLHLLPV